MKGASVTGKPVKVAEAIARFCSEQGSGTAFGVAGGASLHLIHAFASTAGCAFIPVHHEMSAAMAADAYSRSTEHIGLALATGGPGATNLITGIAGAFYDSIPVLFITGQVSTGRATGSTGVRQIGFQETPITQMIAPITKSAVHISSPGQIRAALEQAFWAMTQGRPGPSLIDIPDDIQRAEVIWDELEGFRPPAADPLTITPSTLEQLQELLDASRRPVLIPGGGIKLARAESAFREFAERMGIPVVPTWATADLLPRDHPLRVDPFGTHGSRSSNFVVQNADLILSIGSRLDTKATGSPVSSFARGARKVMVDIDPAELHKFAHFDLTIDLPIHSDAAAFLDTAAALTAPALDLAPWFDQIEQWQQALGDFDDQARTAPGVQPYDFMKALQQQAPDQLDIFVDTGCALAWLMQGFAASEDQRVFHDLNNTAMGWSLPATIGGSVGNPDRQQLCIVGDGSLMMAVHDLSTIAALNPSARLVLIDNSGYTMIKQTQDQWLGSEYFGSSIEQGLEFPDFGLLAQASGWTYSELTDDCDPASTLQRFFTQPGPQFMRVEISPAWRVIPQVRFGRPNEDMEPLLPRAQFLTSMIIDPLPVSQAAD